jgi:hypothetical protein
VALYRAGGLAEASSVLERNAVRHYRMSGYDWVFLAMCQQRLGQVEAARGAMTEKLQWRDYTSGLTSNEIAECQVFVSEAESVVGRSLANLPAIVFNR